MADILCFYSVKEKYGFMSNWYHCEFEENGIRYISSEQYMMYKKAMLFGDQAIADQILKTRDNAKIKALGRKVASFDPTVWDAHKTEIMEAGLFAKFSQNPDIREKLLSTGDMVLAEASGRDRIWGIGLSMKSPFKEDMNAWKGTNMLGQSLMNVRQRLRDEDATYRLNKD